MGGVDIGGRRGTTFHRLADGKLDRPYRSIVQRICHADDDGLVGLGNGDDADALEEGGTQPIQFDRFGRKIRWCKDR